MGLLKLIDNFKKLSIEDVATTSFNEPSVNAALISEQKEQLSEGQDSIGGRIEYQKGTHYPYTKPYEKYKAKLGLQTKVVDLKLKGEYYQGIEAVAKGGKIIIKSRDEKAKYLEGNYGKDLIAGLNSDHKAVFIKNHLRPAFNREIKNKVGL